MSKLALHVQRPTVPEWLRRFAVDAGIAHAVIMQPDLYDAPPFGDTVHYTGRLYFDGEPDKELLWKGTWGAHDYWGLCYQRMERAPWVDMWLGPNEPGWTRLDSNREEAIVKAEAWSAFTERAAAIWHAAGKRLAAGPFSTGTPELALLPWLWPGIKACDALALHAYGMRTMRNPDHDHLLRHRALREALLDYGVNMPLIISETGIDYAGDPERDGWRAQGIGHAEYADQLASYLQRLEQDAEVLYAAPFTWQHEGWPSFALDQAFSENHLLPAIRALDSAACGLGDHAQQYVIPQNPAAAFYAYGRSRGWEPISREFDYDGRRAQVWYSPENETQHIVYCAVGDWADIRHIDRAN